MQTFFGKFVKRSGRECFRTRAFALVIKGHKKSTCFEDEEMKPLTYIIHCATHYTRDVSQGAKLGSVKQIFA